MFDYRINNDESKRINILKFISIVFVVYIHSYAVKVNYSDGTTNLSIPWWLGLIEDSMSQVIARCGVPIFFLISAVLLFKSERKYVDTIRSKFRTLLIPYFIWNTFWIIVFILLQNISFTKIYFSGTKVPILQGDIIDWLNNYGLGTVQPLDYPLWFMRDLMVMVLFFPLIGWITRRFPRCCIIVGTFLVFIPVEIFLKTAFSWFLIGGAITSLDIHITKLDSVPIYLLTLVYVLFLVLTIAFNSHYVKCVFIFISILFWCRVTKTLHDNKKCCSFLLKMSDYTFIIYVFHELTLTSIKKVIMKILPTTPLFLLLEYLLIPVGVIFICILLAKCIEKISPKLYKIVTGGR